jgi:predicted kinase
MVADDELSDSGARGPNASGKSTFLDALTLLRDVLTMGVERALRAIAQQISVKNCIDPAFTALRAALQRCFPLPTTPPHIEP